MTITTETVAELRRLHEAATPGPWSPKHISPSMQGYGIYAICRRDGQLLPNDRGHADLICQAINALPALLDAAERWQRAVRTCEPGATPDTAVECVSHLALADAEAENARLRQALAAFHACTGVHEDGSVWVEPDRIPVSAWAAVRAALSGQSGGGDE